MPANVHVLQRLAAIRNVLWEVYLGGGGGSSATKGRERETFVEQVLSNIMPPIFRIGTGDITDENGHRSGQIDVVIEFALEPSFALVTERAPRLYLAEGVAAAIEIKSDLSNQWHEVRSTAEKLRPLRRRFPSGTMSMGDPGATIPLFAVGYRGWKTIETMKDKIDDQIHCIYVIESNLCVYRNHHGEGWMSGPGALGLFISILISHMKAVIGIGPSKSGDYLL